MSSAPDVSSSFEIRPASRRSRTAGVTLIELVVVIAVVGIFTLVAAPRFGKSLSDQRVKAAARDVADLVLLTRNEAIRTGDNHVLYFGPPGTTDPNGTALVHTDGSTAPLLALNDGPEATANCRIDGGESKRSVGAENGLSWGVANATARAPGDQGAAAFSPPQSSGNTYLDPSSSATNWVLFRPDGIPVVFTGSGGDCGTVARLGSGGAAFYITNGRVDHAIVVSPLGNVTVRSWPRGGSAWSG